MGIVRGVGVHDGRCAVAEVDDVVLHGARGGDGQDDEEFVGDVLGEVDLVLVVEVEVAFPVGCGEDGEGAADEVAQDPELVRVHAGLPALLGLAGGVEDGLQSRAELRGRRTGRLFVCAWPPP
ncbi:hypothetical protein [Kitasatospora sp. NPDC085879]|uniref:hypothetical protein n=1 Tax=Kitasatospora sp. NPDC085879 TaxID=3154769 RepID=UPI000BB0F7F9|nr:hypothetical protein [Streptomyces sp. TLI_235]